MALHRRPDDVPLPTRSLARAVLLLTACTALILTSGTSTADSAVGSDQQAPAEVPAAVTTATYDLGDEAFTDPRSGTVSELRGVVHFPEQLQGPAPVVVQVHGSWWACTARGASTWPCDKGEPFPSYRGYDYLGDYLAGRGFVVVSISMDAINMTSFDYGDRARLLNEHLRLLEELSRGTGPLVGQLSALVGHLDMKRVGTMGHSRGGKGVMWQASDRHRSAWPHGVRVRGVLGVAPVKFDDPEGDNSHTRNTRVPVAVVTSGCDGAVGEQGQEYLDDVVGLTRKPAFSISLTDANHNYYNTQWTPPAPLSEDDSTCPGRELTPKRQQVSLARYAAAFYGRFLQGEPDTAGLLHGDSRLPRVRSQVRVVRPTR